MEAHRDFSQIENIEHSGAMIIGTYDRFTYGDPCGFLRTINAHLPSADENELIFIQQTGHTYQGKEQQLADSILHLVMKWKNERLVEEQLHAVYPLEG